MKKYISLILILTILINIFTAIVCENKSYALTQIVTEDVLSIDESKYPGIKDKIVALQTKYPNWKFKILYTGLDWNSVIANEYVGHGSSPKNLVYKSNNYKGEWICSICGDVSYDNGNWRCASEQAIKYMMDVRNSINESDVFQFEELTNSGCNIDILKTMTNGTFLAGHEQAIIDTANSNNVNGYYIVARLLQEQGNSGTVLTSGSGYNGKFTGYYNAFNIAASGNSTAEILTNALTYAYKKGWTSLDISIKEGISFLANQYISKGQNTLYLQKFDVEATNGLYSNQYMQNILAAQNEGTTLRNTYIKTNIMTSNHTFIIPLYENMTVDASRRPDTNGASDVDIDVVRINADPSLRIRNNPNGDKTVGWLYKNEIVTRIEKATSKVQGTYWDKVRKADGTEGYAARETYENEPSYKLYLVPVNENNNNNTNNNDNNNTDNTNANTNIDTNNNANTNNLTDTEKVKIDKQNNLIYVSPDAIANDILISNGGPIKITKADGSFLNGEQDLMVTGFIVDDKYTVVKKGDANSDGKVNSADALQILKYAVGSISLDDTKLKAANVTGDDKINSADALQILKYAVGSANIDI